MLSDDDIDLPNRGHLATVNEGNENALGSYPNTVAEVVSFDSYGVPRDVQHGEISPKLTADEWKFFRKLSKGVKRTRKITKGLIKHIEEHTEKSFTHLCTLCLVNVEGRSHRDGKKLYVLCQIRPMHMPICTLCMLRTLEC